MTHVENERLAIVETKVDAQSGAIASLAAQVGGLDAKLDSVVLYIAGQISAKTEQKEQSAFRRWALPIVVTVGVTGVNAYVALNT